MILKVFSNQSDSIILSYDKVRKKAITPAQPHETDWGYISSSKPYSARCIVWQLWHGPTPAMLSNSLSLQSTQWGMAAVMLVSTLCLGIVWEKATWLEPEYAREGSNNL